MKGPDIRGRKLTVFYALVRNLQRPNTPVPAWNISNMNLELILCSRHIEPKPSNLSAFNE